MKAISNTLFTSDSGEPRGIVDRSEFMIDGFRVGYETGAGCRCVCVEFATHASCKHAREAAGRWPPRVASPSTSAKGHRRRIPSVLLQQVSTADRNLLPPIQLRSCVLVSDGAFVQYLEDRK